LRFEVEDPKHLHAIRRDGIFFVHHADVAKAEGFTKSSPSLPQAAQVVR
jgi:hypothetical protein